MALAAIKSGEGYVEIGIRNRIEQGAKGVQDSLDKLGTKITRIGAMMSAASGAALAGPLIAASRVQETMSKFNVVFSDSATEMRKWSDEMAATLGTTQGEMSGMLAGMQDLLVPMGMMPAHATGVSKTLSKLAVDLGSFNDMETDRVFADLMAAMTGSGEVMKKYGVILTETAVKQEMLAMGLDPAITDNAAKAQARLNIIMRGTIAAQGDAVRTADEFANAKKRLWSAIMDVSAALGGPMIGSMGDFVSLAATAVNGIGKFVKANTDLVYAAGAATVAVGVTGAGMIAAGAAAKAAAMGIGAFVTASNIATAGISIAWKAATYTFYAFQIKAIISAKILQTVWSVAASAIGVAWRSLGGILSTTANIISTAWSVLSTVLSSALSTAAWVAGAAIVAAAWGGAAFAISAAMIGVDATLTGAAAIASAAWGAASSFVSAAWGAASGFIMSAWTASSGVIASLAGVATTAWGAAATFIASAWSGLSAVITAFTSANSVSAGISAAAWTAYSMIRSAITAKGIAESGILAAAWTAASGIASTAWAGFTWVLSSALAPASLMSAAAFTVSAAWTTAAAIATTAWSTFWAVVFAPITPIILAVGAVGAVFLAEGAIIAGVLGSLLVSVTDFGAAWSKVKSMVSGVVGVIKLVSSTLMGALSVGDYGMAAEALWAGIRLAFWEGVAGVIDAFKWMYGEALAMGERFFVRLTLMAMSSMSAIVYSITHPLDAAGKLASTLADLSSMSVSFDVSSNADEARKELNALMAKIETARKKNKSESEAKALKDELKTPAEVEQEKRDIIDKMERSGEVSHEEASKMRAELDRRSQSGASDGDSDVFAEKVKAIELEILALEQGQDAADRKRLADEGLTEAQIKQIEVLKAKKKVIEELAAAEKEASRQRADAIFTKAEEWGDKGVSPAEIYKRVNRQIDSDEKAGRINKDDAADARTRANDNLDNAMRTMEQQANAMADAMRTPLEELNARKAEIERLRGIGDFDDTKADRALSQAEADFEAARKRNQEKASEQDAAIEETMRRTGPSGTFSAFAANLVGGAVRNFEREQLKASQQTAKNTAATAKHVKNQRNGGRFT
ncbi:hypothetical protein Q31b_41980 [Novipirellula aureliae]|uniref:Uncharacterized protein n=1 Tax=Novipirellula aureliae TaxID=2527966 RepID=A0A5C6DS85_9BACT|nr:hypothetical protein [Novipirellula aureliae]TWU39115.1 hypothetical protein Q31b_41980 [Novipirellula aureliae]